MSSVDNSLTEHTRRVIDAAFACPESADREWLRRELLHKMKFAMVQVVWAMEENAGIELGSTPSLTIK